MNLATGGMTLKHPNGDVVRFFCKLGMILQDGAAHKLVWQCKGDAGTRMCMLCRNLIAESALGDMLTCNKVHESEMDMATDEDIIGTLDRLAACKPTLSKAMFELRQQAVGFNYSPHSILQDKGLREVVRPVSQFCHDWMHAIFVNGVFQTVTHLVISALVVAGLTDCYGTMYNYISNWVWPSRICGTSLKDVFSKKRLDANKRSDSFKCTASEGLSIYPVISYFLQAVALKAGAAVAEATAFLAMADLIDVLQATPHGNVSASLLRDVTKRFLDLCLAAGWKENLHPKFHWLIHLPNHLDKFLFLPTCWVHERKHRIVKRYADDICNTRSFEKSILSEVCCHNMTYLKKPDLFSFEPGLIKPHKANSRLVSLLAGQFSDAVDVHTCYTSSQARTGIAGSSCARTDVVLLQGTDGRLDCGEVWLHAEANGRTVSIVSVWTPASDGHTQGSGTWVKKDNPQLIPTSDILEAVVYSLTGSSEVRVLIPFHVAIHIQSRSA